MKNKIVIAACLLISATSMISCKKDYTCKCSKTYTSGSGSYTHDYSVYTYKDTRKRAEDRCNANSATSSDLGGNYSVNCEIQ